MKGVDIESLRGFLDGLRPQLELARKVESELDRRMARRFNVLDYISTSELGLSRVIADLLNPKAAHGQGTLFLDVLLRGLKQSSERGDRPLDLTKDYGDWDVDDKSVQVKTERTIPGGRRLDVWVEIGVQDDRRCLAIENKPYAGDGGGQVTAYLDYLEKEYRHRPNGAAAHCLVYLPGSGEMPAQWSIDDERKEKEKRERDFVVLPYSRTAPSSDAESEGDDDAAFLLDYTLADWFRDCRRACDVDRLRWFLGDAASFCERRFGGNAMTDTTGDQLNEVLMKQLDMVGEVILRWPSIRAEVIERFAGRLSERICEQVEDDIVVKHSLTGDKLPKWDTGISMTRADDAWRIGDQWVSVRAEAQGNGAMDWVIGVGTTKGGLIRNALEPKLSKALGEKRTSNNWPWLEYVDKRWRWWGNDTILELAQKRGEAEGYFVKRFVAIFEAAKNSIDSAVAEARLRDA